MNKLATLIANGDVTVEELANAHELIERAQLVTKGIESCRKNLTFPFGVKEIQCYSYTDFAGEYEAWGTFTSDGVFTCYCNWGGNHVIGRCNLTDFREVFMAFENSEFESNINRFLNQQIKKAN